MAIAVQLAGCALVDGLRGDHDGSPGPDTTDAVTGQCPELNCQGPFDEPTSAAGPTTVAMGDFDGDTFLDVAVGESTGIEFFFGNGGGGFPRNQLVPNGVSKSFDLVAGEFDGALDDLVGASDDSGYPSPLIYGNENPAELAVTASGLGRAVALEVYDLEGVGSFSSGDPEMTFPANPKRMVRFPDQSNSTVLFAAVLECNPCDDSPIFQTYDRDRSTVGSQSYTGFGAISPVEAVVAKVDGDGQADLVLANGMGTGTSPPEVLVATCWNGEKFGRLTPLDVGGTPADVAVGDLDGDGLDDIVAAIPTTNRVAVMLSKSAGGR